MKPAKEGAKRVCENRKARFDYHILETFEAGIVLSGAEVKSIRDGEITIAESYVRPTNGEMFLLNAYVRPYSHSGGDKEYDPRRPRKLLMHKREIAKLVVQLETKGLTIVPLDVHLTGGRVKITIALGKGKAAPDKREAIKERESKREMDRALRGK